jgi:hypothetical protein
MQLQSHNQNKVTLLEAPDCHLPRQDCSVSTRFSSCAPYAHATASPQRGRSCGPRDMSRQIAMSRQTANDSATTSIQSLVRATAVASRRTRIGAQRVQRDIQCQTTTASTSDKAVHARLSQTAEPHLCSYVKRRRHIRCLAAKIAEPC